jgi:hypothetical protein
MLRLLLIVLAATASIAHAATFFTYTSQPGDPAGKGGSAMMGTEGGETFSVGANLMGQVAVSRSPTYMYLAFGAGGTVGNYKTLVPGTYENAERLGGNGPPSMDISLQGFACETAYGRFVVHEIEYSASAVTRFAVDFEYHCDGSDAAMFGAVRYNSSIPYTAVNAGTATLTPATITVSSFAVDPLLHGERATLTNAQAQLRRAKTYAGGAKLTYGPDSYRPEWTFIIDPPAPGPLKAGTFDTDNVGGYSVSIRRKTQECWKSHAHVVVHEVEFDGYGVKKLAADIQWACNDPTVVTTYIGIRYDSALAYVDPLSGPGAPTSPTIPQSVQRVSAKAPTTGSTLTLSLAGAPPAACTIANYSLIAADASTRPALPDGFVAPYGYMDFRADSCGAFAYLGFTLESSDPFPPTAQLWVYGPTLQDPTPHWWNQGPEINGNKLSFSAIDGQDDTDHAMNGSVGRYMALVVPGGPYQDLWWAGQAENGWGMTVIQHRDALFANFFVYDAQGKPIWYVMPSGSWNASRTAFTGSLYLPKGSPYGAYDVSRFNVGSAVGTATLTFANFNQATLDYTINGVTARKSISKLGFGPTVGAYTASLPRPWDGDLWWGGVSQNGWGMALLKQYQTYFLLWYTYDANGDPTWFVMPKITGFGYAYSPNTWQGEVYRPEGPPWLGVPYDASRHRVVSMGTFLLKFEDPNSITFTYTLGINGVDKGTLHLTRIPF